MKLAIKCVVAILVGLGWQIVSGDLTMACILAGFVFAILCISPKKERPFEDGDEFKQKVRERNEQKLFLEEERLLEKQQVAERQQQVKIKNKE